MKSWQVMALLFYRSAMSRYLKELSERGIVQKENISKGSNSFFIEEAYRKHIASAMERTEDG